VTPRSSQAGLGQQVRQRYRVVDVAPDVWDEITPTSARWQQAFSVDGERTWETNWTMVFTRATAGDRP
jgi:hypothetical protein